MDQIIDFTMNHSILLASFMLVAGTLIYLTLLGDKGSIDPLEATEMINHQEAVVIDIRPAADFQKGHIINAINVPSNGLSNQLGALKKYKDKPVIVSCRSGSQSTAACSQLRKAGFDSTYNLRGGLLAWQSANLPLTRKK